MAAIIAGIRQWLRDNQNTPVAGLRTGGSPVAQWKSIIFKKRNLGSLSSQEQSDSGCKQSWWKRLFSRKNQNADSTSNRASSASSNPPFKPVVPRYYTSARERQRYIGTSFLKVYKTITLFYKINDPGAAWVNLQKYELKGVLIQGYYRNRVKSSQEDSVRRVLVLAGFLTVFDALRICWTTRQKVFNIFSIFNIFNIFNIF